MKWFENLKIGLLLPKFLVSFLVTVVLCPSISHAAETVIPVADAGLSRYAGHNPVVLDGTGSYDPDNSGPLSYTWQQISGQGVVISDADTATPTISGFVQTDGIQECEFELVVSDGELTSLPDTVKVIIVPSYPLDRVPELRNEFFDPDKPTIVYFGGGDGVTGGLAYAWSPFRDPPWDSTADMDPAWISKANIIEFSNGYKPDSYTAPRYTYYRCGDMIIVYLSSVAQNYEQAIQISGHSTGGLPAMDVGLHLNLTYKDRRYAVNRVTIIDSGPLHWRSTETYDILIDRFLASSVDGEQCWIDDYWWGSLDVFRNVLNVQYPVIGHADIKYWYGASLTYDNMNQFNNGVVAGAYWSVIGPGKNLQLASTGDYTYVFKWPGGLNLEEPIELFDESSYPGRLPEPVTLVEPIYVGDSNLVILTCEESENAVGYELLLGTNPYRVMDYNIITDTPIPPNDVVALPFEEGWWTIRVRDQYGSTIYADPKKIGTIAINPDPANGSIHPYTFVALGWSAGICAASHDVYFGENYEDVDAGAQEVFQGNQVSTFLFIGLPGFSYPDGLIPGTTYYWRVDEFEDDSTRIHKGNIWGFTVIPENSFDDVHIYNIALSAEEIAALAQ